MANPIVYGPVPSRRLGRSLGVNNVPPKVCSYSCVYCQLGKTIKIEAELRPFYRTARIVEQASTKLEQAAEKGEIVDYVSFVPDGEPTLDANLGEEIEALKGLGVRVAVITNGSLLWREEVRRNLLNADWLSVKVDAAGEETWHRVNRPHSELKLEMVLEGMLEFTQAFEGKLTTESLLVKGINDDLGEIERVADFLVKLSPDRAYVAIPTRPPAERVEPATEQTINAAYQIFKQRLDGVEYLIGYEGNAFACTGDPKQDLLSITAVHPMREEAVAEFLKNAGTNWGTIQELVDNGSLLALEYQGKRFYMRRLPGRSR